MSHEFFSLLNDLIILIPENVSCEMVVKADNCACTLSLFLLILVLTIYIKQAKIGRGISTYNVSL